MEVRKKTVIKLLSYPTGVERLRFLLSSDHPIRHAIAQSISHVGGDDAAELLAYSLDIGTHSP